MALLLLWGHRGIPALARVAPILPVQPQLLSCLLRRSLVAVPRCWTGSWAVTSPLQVSGRGCTGASLVYEGIRTVGPVVPPGTSPPRASRRAPQPPGGCWLWNTKLFALLAAGLDSFTPFAVGAARPSVAQPSLGQKGLRVTLTGTLSPGCPLLCCGGSHHCREGRCCPVAVLPSLQ